MNRFAVDTAITFLSRIIQLIMGIGISVIIARVLGPQGNGIYTLAILFPTLIVNFANFGIGEASVFFLGKQKYSEREIYGNNIFFSIIFSAAGLILAFLIIVLFKQTLFSEVSSIYLYLGLLLIPAMFFMRFGTYFLLGLQKIKQYNLISILRAFIFLILLLVLLLTLRFDVKAAIATNIVSWLLAAILLLCLIRQIIGSFQVFRIKSYFKNALQYGFKVYLGSTVGWLHYHVDIFLINILSNPLAVGFYSVAVIIIEKLWMISQAAGVVLFPHVSSEANEDKLRKFTPLVCRNILVITCIAAIILFFLSRVLIVTFYSMKFVNSIVPFQILLIGAVTMSGWRILAVDIYGRGRPELNIYISSMCLLLNVLLNLFLIPKYGIVGAAWATSCSYTLAFVLITIVYHKLFDVEITDMILIKISDLKFYGNFVTMLRDRYLAP